MPLQRLWDAWADPAMLGNWFTEEAEQDFRVGGCYSNSDGDRGEFLAIEPLDTISFTWEQPDYAPGGVVTVRFRPLGDQVSELVLEHTGIACDDEADLRTAWTMALDGLRLWLETGRRSGD